MYSDEDRQMHVASWKQSGMTQSDYAQLNGMSAKTLGNWCRDQRYQQPQRPIPTGASNVLYQENERQEHIRRWQESGLSVSAYADLVGVNRNTFHTWLRKYRERASEVSPGLQDSRRSLQSGITAVPEETVKELGVSSAPVSQGIRIKTAEGLQIEILSMESVGIAVELMRQWEARVCG